MFCITVWNPSLQRGDPSATVELLPQKSLEVFLKSTAKCFRAGFIEFILSTEGQELLLDPKIRRLPVNPATYAKAPKDFPNPFKDKTIGAAVKFDLALSKGRYNVINSLFDVMITYRLDDLREAIRAIQKAEAKLERNRY